VVNLRARGSSDENVYDTKPTNTSSFCTGYHFELNRFERNYGCTKFSGGAVKI